MALAGPVVAALLGQPAGGQTAGWVTLCFAGAMQISLLSMWTKSIGAGGLAGPVALPTGWLTRSLILGPACLLVPSLTVAQLFPDQAGWQYSDDVDPSLFEPENWALGFILYAVLIAPILEEMTCRGVALSVLRGRGLPTILSVIVSSAAFASIHLQYSPAALAVVFLAGVGFCFVRIASGSILAAILAHASANGVMLLLQIA